MKKILLALGILTGTFAQAESIDVSELSEYEKKVHRLAWCYEMGRSMLYDEVPKFDYQLSNDVFFLMSGNGFFKQDSDGSRRVLKKTRADLKTEVILGKTFTAEETADCNRDAKAILKNDSVPNFKYLGDTN